MDLNCIYNQINKCVWNMRVITCCLLLFVIRFSGLSLVINTALMCFGFAFSLRTDVNLVTLLTKPFFINTDFNRNRAFTGDVHATSRIGPLDRAHIKSSLQTRHPFKFRQVLFLFCFFSMFNVILCQTSRWRYCMNHDCVTALFI